jgi:ATP-dependent DNA ligase
VKAPPASWSEAGTELFIEAQLRSGRDATARFPELVEAIAGLPARMALLDRELVIFGHDGRSDFEALRARAFWQGAPGVASR